MVCEQCSIEHQGIYGSGRFCGASCARTWTSRKDRTNKNKKISKALKGRQIGFFKSHQLTPEQEQRRRISLSKTQKRLYEENCVRDLRMWKSGANFSERRCKNLLIFERDEKCEICGWAEVNPFTGRIPIELEHKDGDCYNNQYENLALLCPNHQSLTPTYRGANARKGRGRKMYKVISRWAKENKIVITTGNNL
jgi:hypothetical protein